MSWLTTRSAAARTIAIATAGLTLAAAAALAPPASAASNGFIAAPNGMVGVPETITINAPSAAGQVVTIGLQFGAIAQTLQTTIGANGYGSVTWTPTAAGTWGINGLGTIVSSGSTTLTVAPMPTYTVLLAQNALQQGVANSLLAAVIAPIGNLAPTGAVTLSTSGGAALTSAPLTGLYGSATSTAQLSWNPPNGGPTSIQAAYQPASGGQLASTSQVSNPNVQSSVATVALRWPASLYVGSTTVLQAVLGTGIPDGSAAFLMDGAGISGSIATTNGVASLQWAPPSSGIHTITVNYTGNKPGFSGSSSQLVNVQGARVADNLTVDPPTQPVWSIAQPIVMRAGTTATLVGTSASGTTVLFSEQGPCVIAGSTLRALSAGQCQVTAFSPGNEQLTPGSETYTVTVQKPPKKR
jgi:hypothetical protein